MLNFSRPNLRVDRRIRRCAAAAIALSALFVGGGCASDGGSGGGSVVQKAHVQRDRSEPAVRERSEYRAFGQRLEEARLAVPAGYAGTVVVRFHEFPGGRMVLHVNENSPGTMLEIRSPEGGGGQPLAGTISAGPVDRTITIEAAALPSPVQGQQQCELRVAASHPAPAAQRIQTSFNLARVCKIGQPDGPTDSLPLADITFDLGKH
jgi:hypothetical protein